MRADITMWTTIGDNSMCGVLSTADLVTLETASENGSTYATYFLMLIKYIQILCLKSYT